MPTQLPQYGHNVLSPPRHQKMSSLQRKASRRSVQSRQDQDPFEKLLQAYMDKLEQYKMFKVTFKIKHYLDEMPVVSKSISSLLHEYEPGNRYGTYPGEQLARSQAGNHM